MCFVIVLGTVLYGALFGPYIAKKKLAPPLAHNKPSRLRLLLSRARYSKRLRIGFGGINLGLGALSLTALTLIVTGIINPSPSPLGSTLIMALLLGFGVLQIVAGILNVMD